jgi:hypothetical protein
MPGLVAVEDVALTVVQEMLGQGIRTVLIPEPMTYALRGGFGLSRAVHRATFALLIRLGAPQASEIIQSCC